MLPRDQILRALKLQLKAVVPVVDGAPAWKVRHERFRQTTIEEMPCLAIRYLADDASGVANASDESPSIAEEAMHLRVDFIVDTPIPPESDRETAGDADEGEDPTGLGDASKIIETSLDALFPEGGPVNTLGGLVWDIRYDGSGDNDDLVTSDNVRLAERLTFVYRVRAEAPHRLLIGE
jgi:hypothetical protein